MLIKLISPKNSASQIARRIRRCPQLVLQNEIRYLWNARQDGSQEWIVNVLRDDPAGIWYQSNFTGNEFVISGGFCEEFIFGPEQQLNKLEMTYKVGQVNLINPRTYRRRCNVQAGTWLQITVNPHYTAPKQLDEYGNTINLQSFNRHWYKNLTTKFGGKPNVVVF